MKNKKPAAIPKGIEKLQMIQVALFSNPGSPEKRELLRHLEFQKNLREHLSDVVRSVRALNKNRGTLP